MMFVGGYGWFWVLGFHWGCYVRCFLLVRFIRCLLCSVRASVGVFAFGFRCGVFRVVPRGALSFVSLWLI